MEKFKVLGAGFLISWLGALPFGTLNITALDISATSGIQAALLFAIAAVSVELFYVRLSLLGNKKWTLNQQWVTPLLLLGALLLGYLAVSNFLTPVSVEPYTISTNKTAFQKSINSPILLGILLSALNPLQFPFWLTWNKVLTKKNILQHTRVSNILYMLGIGIGTFLALSLFIWMGSNLVSNYQVYAEYSNKIIGIIYLGFSLYLMFLFFQRSFKPVHK